MQSQFSDNPFATINAPQNGPVKQAGANIDDLLNPFAVLGMNAPSKAPVSFAPQGWASGAGSVSPVNAPPQIGSAQSAFQAPGSFQPQPQAYGSTSPAFGAPVAPIPQAAYGSVSPVFGAPAPQQFSSSPAFGAPVAPQPGYGAPAQDPFAFRPPQPGYGNGLTKPVVMDADLSLFSAPTKTPPPQSRSPAPPQQQAAGFDDFGPSFGAAPVKSTTPVQEQQWGDDFGISWESPRKEAPKEKAAPQSASPAPSDEIQTRSPQRGTEVNTGDLKLEGDVLARISVRTLIVKEWKQSFWIITGGKLLLYRNKEDYLYNPVGVMVKKDIPLRDNLRCSEVTCKPYKGYGDLSHFTLEEMLDYGPSLIAKFASTNAADIRDLRAVIIQHIIAERKKRIGHMARPEAGGESRYSPSPNNGGNGSDDKYAKWGNISHN